MTSLLAVENLACGYSSGRPTLAEVALRVEEGETVVLVGPSGSGKTTLLKTILGLMPPLAGTIEIDGVALPTRPPAGHVGYIPQGLGLVRHASVMRNVLLGTLPRCGGLAAYLGVFPAHCEEAARDAIARVGLAGKEFEKPIHLSGGERRRVAIARAIAQRPRLLLADEILSELDIRTAEVVLGAVRELKQDTNMGTLLVEHNLDVAWEIGDTVCCLGKGAMVATLTPKRDERSILQEVFPHGA